MVTRLLGAGHLSPCVGYCPICSNMGTGAPRRTCRSPRPRPFSVKDRQSIARVVDALQRWACRSPLARMSNSYRGLARKSRLHPRRARSPRRFPPSSCRGGTTCLPPVAGDHLSAVSPRGPAVPAAGAGWQSRGRTRRGRPKGKCLRPPAPAASSAVWSSNMRRNGSCSGRVMLSGMMNPNIPPSRSNRRPSSMNSS